MKSILIGIVIFVVLTLGILEFRYQTAPLVGRTEEAEIINSGANRIYQYESFFNQCAAIEGYESSIKVQEDSLKSVSAEDKSRIAINIAGIKSQRSRAIAQYNADVLKYTKTKFLDAALPLHLDEDSKTTCTK